MFLVFRENKGGLQIPRVVGDPARYIDTLATYSKQEHQTTVSGPFEIGFFKNILAG